MGKLGRTAAILGFLSLSVAVSTAAGPVAWKFKTGWSVYATPVIRDGVCYIGSLDSVFYAIDVKTGLERWHYRSPNQIFSTASVKHGIVCFESDNTLFGLDLQGTLKWQTRLCACPVVNRHDGYDDFHSSPFIVDTVAYIGSEQGRVAGVDIRSGAVVFECQTPSGASTVETTPMVYDGKVYFGTWDGVLYAYDIASAAKVWEYDTRNDNTYGWVNAIFNQPLIWNGSLYFAGRSCNLYCLDPETGARKWIFHDPTSMWLLGGPVVSDSVMYIGSSNQYVLHAFNPVTGALMWRQAVDYRIYGNPLVDGEFVFFGTGNDFNEPYGSLYCADRLTGALKNRLPVNGQVHSSPVVVDGILFVGSADGFVYAVDRQEFIENPLPETGYKDKSKVTLGDIPANQTDFRTSLTLFNTGNGPDSISMRLVMPIALTTSGAVTLDPLKFSLAPGDSQVMELRLDASKIKPARYTIALFYNSAFNLNLRTDSKTVYFVVTQISGLMEEADGPPASSSLEPNYPNPFNPRTTLRYSLPEAALVRFELFDMLGHKVRILADGVFNPGWHSVEWDGSDGLGCQVGTGVYFCRLSMTSGGRTRTRTRKILLMK